MKPHESGCEPSMSRTPYVGRQPTGVDRLLVPAAPVGIGGERGDAAADVARRLGHGEPGWCGRTGRLGSNASRQLSSVTPNASSIISERSHPGVTRDGRRAVGASSWPCENASRLTATLARS